MLRYLTGRRVVDDRGIRRLLLIGMALGFAALLAAALAIVWISARGRYYSQWVAHTYQVQADFNALQNTLERSEVAYRGYLLTGRERFGDGYRDFSAQLSPLLAGLERLTRDNQEQAARLAKVERELVGVRDLRDRSVALVDAGRTAEALAVFRTERSVNAVNVIRQRLQAGVLREKALLAQRRADLGGNVRLSLIILVLAALLIIVVAVTSLVTVLRHTRVIDASRRDLRTANASLEDRVEERTLDLRLANDEIQRFAYIVSHDLRSPLVNVMGFTAELETATRALAELVDRAEQRAPDIVTEEARLAAREDLPEAIGFIRTSTAKMDRLINAILRLSREGRRVLVPEPLDMTGLVCAIRDTLQHRLDVSGATLEVMTLPPITADRVAVEQVLSNVVENAVKYLDPARRGTIEVSGTVSGGRALYSVKDNGRGIAASDHQRIFDLFRRSGTQDQAGEGIGLAHVRALTNRLGGSIEVESALGQGTTFRIALPVKPQDLGEAAA